MTKIKQYEWDRAEKTFYFPKPEPAFVSIPSMKFITLEGSSRSWQFLHVKSVNTIISTTYAIKSSPKRGIVTEGYFDYKVYPMECIWYIPEEIPNESNKQIKKVHKRFKLLCRQPDFVTKNLVHQITELCAKTRPHLRFKKIKFEEITEGDCIEMLHLGHPDNIPESLKKMEEFAEKENYIRTTKNYHEIYVKERYDETAKTILRFSVTKKEH
jgi:hypothetical protein